VYVWRDSAAEDNDPVALPVDVLPVVGLPVWPVITFAFVSIREIQVQYEESLQ
jgi:hypothetical protein